MTGTLEGWIYNGELWSNCTATTRHESGQSLPNLFGFSIVSFFHKFVSAQTLDVKFQLFGFSFKVPIGNEERSDKSCRLISVAGSVKIMPSKMEVASQHWTDWTDWTVETIEVNRKI